MGMDVYGNAPAGEPGAYFRRSMWGWRPLATFVTEFAPEETKPCRYWQSNDGDGLSAEASIKLADKLDALIADGTVAGYVAGRDEALAAVPDDPCTICGGTGIRTDKVGQDHGWPRKIADEKDSDDRPNPRAGQVGSCNACRGAGKVRPTATWYGLDQNDVAEFAAFVRASGGFRIC